MTYMSSALRSFLFESGIDTLHHITAFLNQIFEHKSFSFKKNLVPLPQPETLR